jgi:hypothetical protein
MLFVAISLSSEIDGSRITLLVRLEWSPTSMTPEPPSVLETAVNEANEQARTLMANSGKTLPDRWVSLLNRLEQFVPLVDKIAEVSLNPNSQESR